MVFIHHVSSAVKIHLINFSIMKHFIGKKVLITTQNWFYGSDGRQYRAVHGTLKAIHSVTEDLGFTPNRVHTNWTIEIGNMIIMGCQVLYVQQSDSANHDIVHDWVEDEGAPIKLLNKPSTIYKVD